MVGVIMESVIAEEGDGHTVQKAWLLVLAFRWSISVWKIGEAKKDKGGRGTHCVPQCEV
jgi:hypothetical protein